jgi:hypothetical protein
MKQQSNIIIMMATTRKRSNNHPPSPKTKKLRKAGERVYQQHAFRDLLLHCNLNGGKLQYGDFQEIVSEYQSKGFASVTTRNLCYRQILLENKGTVDIATEVSAPTMQVIQSQKATTISSLTGDEVVPETSSDDDDVGSGGEELGTSCNKQQSSVTDPPQTKRLKKNQKQKYHLQYVQLATTKAAADYHAAKTSSNSSKLPSGTLQKFIVAAEMYLVYQTVL